MINIDFDPMPDGSISWTVEEIDVVYELKPYFIDCGISESEEQAQIDIKEAIESFFEESPSAKEKYGKSSQPLDVQIASIFNMGTG